MGKIKEQVTAMILQREYSCYGSKLMAI
jgi:hypothetical protein